MPRPGQPHRSSQLGLISLAAGVAGSGIAYLGLWLGSDTVGLVGFGIVTIAVTGAIGSLFWNLAWIIARKRDQRKR